MDKLNEWKIGDGLFTWNSQRHDDDDDEDDDNYDDYGDDYDDDDDGYGYGDDDENCKMLDDFILAKLTPNRPKPDRPKRQGAKKESVECGLAAAAAKFLNRPVSVSWILIGWLIHWLLIDR